MIEVTMNKKMKINYFKNTNSISIKFEEKASFDTREISNDIIADFDEQGKIIALEILALPKDKSINSLIAIGFNEVLQS